MTFFTLSTMYSLKGSHYSQPTIKEWGVYFISFKAGQLHKLFKNILHRTFVCIYACTYVLNLVLISVWNHGFLFST